MIRAGLILAVFWAVVAAGVSAGIARERGFGEVPEGGFRSPEGDTRFTAAAGAKPLNNLVFRLLKVQSPGTSEHVFRNPREGWVYVCVPKPKALTPKLPIAVLDGKEVALESVGGQLEAMRYLSEGPHRVAMARWRDAVDGLEVRAIGELFYAAYGSNPHIAETGNYTWEFLRRHCLDSFNSIIGSGAVTREGKSTQEAEIKAWTDAGKRWFTLHPVPDNVRVSRPTKTADEAYDYWTRTLGMQHPLTSGIFADEFGPKQAKFFPMWIEALRRIHADPTYAGRKFYAYCPNRFWPLEDGYEVMFPFVQALMDCGYRMAPEWYQVEGKSRPGRTIAKTKDLQAELGPSWEMTSRQSFERASRGAATNRIIVVSLISEPGNETGDLYARYDFNVFLDCQLQFLATDPAFFAARGLQGYLSSYCSEEQLRLFAKLVRHYAIEGRTDRMLQDPYVLTHLENPDVEGAAGWTLEPAVAASGQASIAARTARGFGILQAKYHAPEGAGDAVLWTKRSARKPNVISQPIRNLEPGRLYSLRFITGDYQELVHGKSVRRKHAVSARIEGGDVVAEKCFQAIIGNGYWYAFGPFDRKNQYWMNYHQQVFRARAKAARLVLADWKSEQAAGGPEGEEMIWNFIQVQPYFE